MILSLEINLLDNAIYSKILNFPACSIKCTGPTANLNRRGHGWNAHSHKRWSILVKLRNVQNLKRKVSRDKHFSFPLEMPSRNYEHFWDAHYKRPKWTKFYLRKVVGPDGGLLFNFSPFFVEISQIKGKKNFTFHEKRSPRMIGGQSYEFQQKEKKWTVKHVPKVFLISAGQFWKKWKMLVMKRSFF
jgi:hypothetical protein